MTMNNNEDNNNNEDVLDKSQDKQENKDVEYIDPSLLDRDIKELSDAFEDYMDNIIDEEKKSEINKMTAESPLKDILPDLTSPYNADNMAEDGILDEEDLSQKYDDGYFESQDKEKIEQIHTDDYEDLSENREKRIFYAALYLSGKPVEISTFSKMLNPINLENRLLTYAEEFNHMNIGVRIRMVSGGYQIVADSEVTIFLEKYFGEKTESLSRASLETAAIIAYRQPVTKAEVEEMREVNSSGTMKYLLDKNLIKVVGRKQVPGKPLLYATTKYFLEYFGLNDLSELPTFREWQELKQNQ